MKPSIIIAALAMPLLASASITPLWLRDAKISPDGSTIAFCYKGDVWTVPATGGEAKRITTVPSYEATPIWSPDSKKIAFQSDRYGNFDIFIVDANGGTPVRLTSNSASETPEAFTPDGKSILFSASIQDPAESALFPSGRMTEVYQVGTTAGSPVKQYLATPAQMISFVPGTDKFVYQDVKGMENEWRKHHTSSAARDIRLYDPSTGKHTHLAAHAGEDRNPVAIDSESFYFLSERNGGSMNVYKGSVSDASAVSPVTTFKTHPVRFLSKSNNGQLCFTYDGEIYTLNPGSKPTKVAITLTEEVSDELKKVPAKATEMAVSPDGKSIAFISNGEVLVTSVDYNTTKQITNTPEAEKHISWGADSKSLYYTSERDGKYNIYKATMTNDADPNFANATTIKEEAVFKADSHERGVPSISPDGKKLAFILDRRKLAVRDIDKGNVRVIQDGSVVTDLTGEVNYIWSPDSKWIAMEAVDRKHSPYTDIALINVEDGSYTNLTGTGYFDASPRFTADGNAIMFDSDRYGMRNHASWGSESDVMMIFLNQDAYDNYKMSKEDAEIAKDAKKKDDADDKEDKDKKDKKADKKDDKKDIVVELDGIQDRLVRLTPFSSSLKDFVMTADGDELYFITSDADKENMLWKKDMRDGKVSMSKTISSGLNHFDTSSDGKTIFILGSSMQKFTPSGEKLTPVNYSATLRIDPAAEREFMFDNMAREEQARFYEPTMHGVDWKGLTTNYRKFLPHINNNYDFSEMLSELLGELNVSHTGSGFRGNLANLSETTASLGLLYDLTYEGNGLKVTEIVKNSPFDNASTKLRAGMLVTKINDQEITPKSNYTDLFTDIAGKKTLITFKDPATGDSWSEVIKPITNGTMNDLLYKRWVAARAADVDKWSNGRLGYVHIQSMGDPSFRPMYADVLGKYYDREGIVIDIRFNGGGRMHEDIEVLFSGKKYLTQQVRGEDVCDMPSRRWNKPSIMVVCEACYSNAHGTPWVYQTMGLGKVVGMPIAGTMTSVNWVNMQDPSVYFGIPVIGYRTADGYYLENHQLQPDIVVEQNLSTVAKGEDAQLKAAVEELLRDIDNDKKK